MYAGTTIRDGSGRFIGVHQKIDRVARRNIEPILPDWCDFPDIKNILHFEGKNGPDGVKRKSPAVDEPWHFINPDDPNDTALLEMIDGHIGNLARALRTNNSERAAFEAAWMAHAITDGLTPAHHFPLEQAMTELRGGEGLETRTSILKKNLMKGDNGIELIKNNWKFWGAKGMMTTHVAFEAGVASVVAYPRFKDAIPSDDEILQVKNHGYREYYLDQVHAVASMKMYDNFSKSGWTTDLAWQTNHELMPIIIKSVMLGWLASIWKLEAEKSES